VIYDEKKGTIIDRVCRAKGKLPERQMARSGWRVLKLLETIDAEAEGRRGASGRAKAKEKG
jgi:hypothetical protein